MCDRGGYFGKSPHRAKMTENGQKCFFLVFGLFKKFALLVLSGICVKRKFLSFTNILQNSMLGKNLVLKLKPEMALAQYDFSIF